MIVSTYKNNVFDEAWNLERCIFPIFMGTIVRKTNSFIAIMMLINANYLQYKNYSKQLPQRRIFVPIVKDADPNTSKNFFLDFYRHLSYKWIDLICLICLIFLESP